VTEIEKHERLKAIAEGTRLWHKLQEKKRIAALARLRMEKPVILPSIEERIKLRQARCSHLKGGRGPRSIVRDYNVGDHTFTDGSRQIKCLTCGREWWQTTTHTDPEWDIALQMTKSSTNRRSSSEIPQKALRNQQEGIKNGPDNLPY